MSIQIGRYARMYLDDLDVYLRSFEMGQSIESVTIGASRYGDDWEIHEVVQGKGGITINSYLDDVYSQGEPDAIVQNSLDLLMWKVMTKTKAPVIERFGLASFGAHSNDAEYVDLNSIVPRLYLLTRMIMDVSRDRVGPAK